MLFWLIETSSQLEEYFKRGYEEAFVEVIPYNSLIHPTQNKVSALYVRPIEGKKGYIFPLSHSEALSLKQEDIEQILDSLTKIYVRDKKEFLHYYYYQNSYDLTLSKPYELKHTKAHSYFYNRFPNKTDISKIIPITKHYENCEKIYNDLIPNKDKNINHFFNTKASVVFNAVERMGLRIDKEVFEKHFHPIDQEYVYTQYNFKTLTTRPSNKFNKINYAALDKSNGCRESFIPKNDKYVEFDITAYHPTILAKLIGYSFKSPDIHGEFAKMYGVSYQESKKITFQQIYGGVFEKYENLEYFSKVKAYTNQLWHKFQSEGFIEDPITKHRFYRDKLEDMNPPKLLNYQIQHIETRNNINLLWDIFKILSGKKTKLILYVYDSFLLDYDKSERDVLVKIKELFDKYKLQIKGKQGKNYQVIA